MNEIRQNSDALAVYSVVCEHGKLPKYPSTQRPKMTFDKHELKLLAAAGAIAAPGAPVKLRWLAGVFARPGKLRETVDKLRLGQFITFDPYQAELRVLARPVLEVLNEYNQTPELFTGERPLDAALAESLKVAMSKDTVLCKKTHMPEPPARPPDSLRAAPEILSGTLRALRADLAGNLAGNLAETLAGTSADILRSGGQPTAPFVALKERHKGIKPLMDLEALSNALNRVETGAETEGYTAMCQILGGVVMEGGDNDARGKVRFGDGGKWRNRWRTNRRKTVRVLAAVVEELKEGKVKSRGGRAEEIWKEFSAIKELR